MDNSKKVFYGSRANPGKIVAYCWKHHLSLTKAQLEKRHCLERQCGALEKNLEHPWWDKERRQPSTPHHVQTFYNRNKLALQNMGLLDKHQKGK